MIHKQAPEQSHRRTTTPEQIRDSYFKNRTQQVKNTESHERAERDLTAAARHVAREARKHIGQKRAASNHSIPQEKELTELVHLIEEEEGEALTKRERDAVIASLSATLEHYDILTPLIENPDINDIIVKSYSDISVQSGRVNLRTDVRFADHESYVSFVENLLKRAGKACTAATPVVDAAIDPHVRACVTHESFSPPGMGPMLTLRVARQRNISLGGLARSELAPGAVLDYLSTLVREAQVTILIAGEVGSGKTTLVRALASNINENEALLIIEDTHEIVLHRPFVRTLLTREANTEGSGRILPAQAIRAGMRMAMNRIILGEMRDADAAEAFIDVCASGHAGISTIHARSAKDALSRLELFLARAQGNIGIEAIRRQVANAVSVIVFLGIDRNSRQRRIFEVVEVATSSDGCIQSSPIFSYQLRGEDFAWRREVGVSQHDSVLRKAGYPLPHPGEWLLLDPELTYRNTYLDARAAEQNSE